MKFTLYGASGMIGSRILTEALGRGHTVTAVVRNPGAIAGEPGLHIVAGDVTSASSVADTAAGSDLAISAFGPGSGPQETLSEASRALLAGLATAKVPRVIVVGGAGGLEVAPGTRLIDAPGFPEMYRARATAQLASIQIFQASPGTPVAWTVVSPAAIIEPGERTGTFRVGGTSLLSDANGVSRISAEDYAIAIVDEAERNAAPNRWISVAY